MPRTSRHATLHSAVAILAAAVAGACTGSGEQVFTRQNKVASALATMAMEAEAKSPAKAEHLYEAESRLQEACAPLREIASRRMTGETVGLDDELVVFITLDRCEAETQRIEAFIRLDDPTIVRTSPSPAIEPVATVRPAQ